MDAPNHIDYEFELWIQPSPQLGDVKTLTEAISPESGRVGMRVAAWPWS